MADRRSGGILPPATAPLRRDGGTRGGASPTTRRDARDDGGGMTGLGDRWRIADRAASCRPRPHPCAATAG
ncbi:MAG: hypothetical protein FWE59_06570, partial [Oscillospiraceae bacterium]|nr:hypothetical protein [Oscillospiraceae bacterium]